MESFQGQPCWFELMTDDVDSARAFYFAVFGWSIADSGMPDMTYLLAGAEDGLVAGITTLMAATDGVPPSWSVYIAVDDCDASTARSTELGGGVVIEPADIPGTGRFAVLTDPQGAAFGILQPLPMTEPQPSAFDPSRRGHGHWIELMTPGQAAGFEFYSALFGWERGDTIPMGEMGEYWIFSHEGSDIGGMMGQGDAPVPAWTPYFGVASTAVSIVRLADGGGTVHHGPDQVPGGQWAAMATDPSGAFFGIVGGE